MIVQDGKDLKLTERNTNLPMSFYWQAYGLSHDPFPTTHDSDVFFPLPEWEEHFDLLQHLIKNENILLAIIGPEGSGKTTFAKQIIQNFSDEYLIHQFAADSLFSTRKLVRELESGFGLVAADNESPEEQLDKQIGEVQHKEKICLLIIDDAHFLPLETLNSLLFLLQQQSKNQMRLHIVLLGDKNLKIKLNNLGNSEFGAAIIQSIDIAPLTLEETKQYIIHRLNYAGLIGEAPLSQLQIEKIYLNSEGVPHRINCMAQQVLLEELNKQKSMTNPTILKKHQTKIIGGALLVVALIAASYVLNKEGRHSLAQNSQAAISFVSQNQTVKLPEQTMGLSQTVKSNTKVEVSMVQPIPSFAHKAASELKVTGPSKLPNIALEAKTLSKLTKHEKKPEIKKKHQNTLMRLSQLENIPAVSPEKPYHVDVIGNPKLIKKFNAEVLGNTQSKKVEKVLHSNGLKITKGEAALINENSNDYTLQVIGLSYEKSMLKFINDNHLQGDVHYVKTTLHGKPWFILVYGVYKTKQEAINAIKTLPSTLQKFKPWPRQLKYVKIDIDRG